MIRSRRVYTGLWRLALPLALARLAWRALRQPEYLRHVGERLGFYRQPGDPRAGRPVIWVHAVSVGETRAAEPLVRALLARHPDHRIVLTHMTPTGRAAGAAVFGAQLTQCYLPYDLPGAVARFLHHFQPRVGILMETELWPNLVHACAVRGIPIYLVNARLSEKSYARYARYAPLVGETLRELTAIAAQGEDDAARLRQLGAPTVSVVGNLKFDVVPAPALIERGRQWRAHGLAGRRVVLAASTRAGEEALLLQALKIVDVPGLLLVIVPRHPQRFDAVAALVARSGLRGERRSVNIGNAPLSPQTQVWLGDSMGELAAYYAASEVAIIGGSLLPYGGQNLIEACAVGVPVIVGPHIYNFAAAARQALQAGAALEAADAPQALRAACRLLDDAARLSRMGEAGLVFAREQRGATARVLEIVRWPDA